MHPGLLLAGNVGRLTGLLAISIETEESGFYPKCLSFIGPQWKSVFGVLLAYRKAMTFIVL